jgi:hypothetical protein
LSSKVSRPSTGSPPSVTVPRTTTRSDTEWPARWHSRLRSSARLDARPSQSAAVMVMKYRPLSTGSGLA